MIEKVSLKKHISKCLAYIIILIRGPVSAPKHVGVENMVLQLSQSVPLKWAIHSIIWSFLEACSLRQFTVIVRLSWLQNCASNFSTFVQARLVLRGEQHVVYSL